MRCARFLAVALLHGTITAQTTPLAGAGEDEAGSLSSRASFLLSSKRAHSDQELLWPGLLSGLRGFEHFSDPIGNPLYFETPFNNTQVRPLFLWHRFPRGSVLKGGHVSVYAAQARLALTERLAFLVTKGGVSVLDPRIFEEEEKGWNDHAIGMKYVFLADREEDLVATAGIRWQWASGDRDILQGGVVELSPFVSAAKGFDRLHLLGNLTVRIPSDEDKGNNILQWDLHLDYDVAPEALPGFAPAVELRGLHYLTNGERTPLDIGGYDYTNLGSTNVAGSFVIALGVGARWKLSPHLSTGVMYDFPISNRNEDIMGGRAMIDLTLTW